MAARHLRSGTSLSGSTQWLGRVLFLLHVAFVVIGLMSLEGAVHDPGFASSGVLAATLGAGILGGAAWLFLLTVASRERDQAPPSLLP
jgi:hypothetical protein